MTDFHPELRAGRFIPSLSYGPRVAAVLRALGRWTRPPRPPADVTVEDLTIPGPEEGPAVRVRLYRPEGLGRPAPALLWIHGGGFIIGRPEQDERSSIAYARELGVLVVAVAYRLAPEHPFPAPLEDCYAALRWLHGQAGPLGVDPDRIAIGGASAGGGLAAGLVLLAHDRGEVRPAFQLLIYPMLDDRTALRADAGGARHRVWNARSNAYGWRSYLATDPGGAGVSPYAAPARREDLSGLPPAWLGVGTIDLFHEEDLTYARRLSDSGVPCEVQVVPGAFHAFDILFLKAEVVRTFWQSHVAALRRALFPGPERDGAVTT
jgi:acetyl esterase/lipase